MKFRRPGFHPPSPLPPNNSRKLTFLGIPSLERDTVIKYFSRDRLWSLKTDLSIPHSSIYTCQEKSNRDIFASTYLHHAFSCIPKSIMLPRPSLSFTLPSIYDSAKLDCRVYHPPSLCDPSHAGVPWSGHAAVVAHPYAPLGGCFDDPIVDVTAGTLLQLGFLVATFNFRSVPPVRAAMPPLTCASREG